MSSTTLAPRAGGSAPARDAVRDAVLSDVASFVRSLYPNAKVERGVAYVGDGPGGESRKGARERGTLHIALDGPRAGQWHDHATGEGGDVFALYAHAENMDARADFPALLAAMGRHLGVAGEVRPALTDDELAGLEAAANAEPSGPTAFAEYRWHDLNGRVVGAELRTEYADRPKDLRPAHVVGFYPDGEPLYKIGAPSEPIPLYAAHRLKTAGIVVFAEGPKVAEAVSRRGSPDPELHRQGQAAWAAGDHDALARINARIEATPWPRVGTTLLGAKAQPEAHDLEPLRGLTVVVAPDNDGSGDRKAAAIIEALTGVAASILLVDIPDDASEGWDLADVSPAEQDRLIAAARPVGAAEEAPTPDLFEGAPEADDAPFDLDRIDGALGEVAAWMESTGQARVPAFAVMSALGFLSVYLGRSHVSPTYAGLNVYLAGLAASGTGKDAYLRAPKALAQHADKKDLVGTGDVASDAAIELMLKRCPRRLLAIDEVGLFLGTVNDARAGQWTRNIRSTLLTLYGASVDAWDGKFRAQALPGDDGAAVQHPNLSVIGMSTPATFWPGLSMANVDDGLLARFLIFVADDDFDEGEGAPRHVRPEALCLRLAHLMPAGGFDFIADDPAKSPQPRHVPWGDGGEVYWRALTGWAKQACARDEALAPLIHRLPLHAQKLATIKAVARGRASEAVTAEDLAWGWGVARTSFERLKEGLERNMATSAHHRLANDIIAEVRRKGGKIANSVLTRATLKLGADPVQRSRALADLCEAGMLERVGSGSRVSFRIPD